MTQLLKALITPWCWRAAAGPGPRVPPDDGRRHRLSRLAGAAIAGTFALLTIAAPVNADGEASLRRVSGTLHGHGAEAQVRVSYRCEEGRTAGVGILLTQANRHGPRVDGGAGSGQRPCTGETETVTLTVSAGSVHYRRGPASVTVSLFTSGPGTPYETTQLTETIRLDYPR